MNNECLLCGNGDTSEISRERRVTVNGHELVVPDDRVTRCANCGETFYTGAQARLADRKLVGARRRAEALLSSDEIRRIRQSLTLSQSELEQVIGTGPKTVVRWENGTTVQGKAADDVLRLIALDPDNLRLLVRIRQAAMVTLVDQRLGPERQKKQSWLEQAIFTALDESFDFDSEMVNRIVKNVSRAILSHKMERIERVKEEVVA